MVFGKDLFSWISNNMSITVVCDFFLKYAFPHLAYKCVSRNALRRTVGQQYYFVVFLALANKLTLS